MTTIPKQQNSISSALPPRIVLALDVCCGPRSMWFDKKDSRAVFVDNREEEHEKPRKCRQNVTRIQIKPDILADFTALPFDAETFWHVVMDPPHYTEKKAGKGHILKHYGCLFPGWKEMLTEGFQECFRVLKPGGTFIFKWCEHEIPLREILALTPHKPLYGHRTGSRQKTHWVAFCKPINLSPEPNQ
jgi:SAM-dependent methyltransferase